MDAKRFEKGIPMVAIASLLIIVTLALLVTRIAAVALTATGLSEESARFQSRSAFTGVGYTTTEAENVVNHPVRRRIVMLLMMVGNVGIVTAVASLLMSFTGAAGPGTWFPRLTTLLGGLAILYLAIRIPVVDRGIHRFIEFVLERFSSLHPRDYARLVSLPGDYGVTELQIQPGTGRRIERSEKPASTAKAFSFWVFTGLTESTRDCRTLSLGFIHAID